MSDEDKRIEIDDLPRATEELTAGEAEGVTGGGSSVPQGKVTFTIDNLGATRGNTVGGSLADDPTRKMGDGSV
jgi:hypothetical protein